MAFSSEAVRASAQTIRWRASHCCKRSLYPLSRHFKRPKPYLGSEDYMLTSTSQPHKINSFYTSPGEAHCIQIGRKPKEQRRLNADIIETTRNSVFPSSEINSGSRETPVCKISKLLQMLQNVLRCCKVEYLSKLKAENRETTTIEIGVVDYPQNDKKAFFWNSMQCCRRPGSCNCCRNPLHLWESVLCIYLRYFFYFITMYSKRCVVKLRKTHGGGGLFAFKATDIVIPQNNLCNINQNAFRVFTSSVGHSK